MRKHSRRPEKHSAKKICTGLDHDSSKCYQMSMNTVLVSVRHSLKGLSFPGPKLLGLSASVIAGAISVPSFISPQIDKKLDAHRPVKIGRFEPSGMRALALRPIQLGPRTSLGLISGMKDSHWPKHFKTSLGSYAYRLAKGHLPLVWDMARKSGLDPYWMTALIYTESHFNPSARSYVNALGLMQILPGTARYIAKKIDFDLPKSRISLIKSLKRPRLNVKLGMAYFNYLLKRFDGNFKYATVAYNMGPNWVGRRLRNGRPVGNKNMYYDKVLSTYVKLTQDLPAFPHWGESSIVMALNDESVLVYTP